MLTSFPFKRQYISIYLLMELLYFLKLANLYLTAVHIEPFPTSVFKVLI